LFIIISYLDDYDFLTFNPQPSEILQNDYNLSHQYIHLNRMPIVDLNDMLCLNLLTISNINSNSQDYLYLSITF
jgi:hypothetical protein